MKNCYCKLDTLFCKLALLLMMILSSCQYPAFQIDGKDAFRLLYINKNKKSTWAYLAIYNDCLEGKDEYKIIEDISKFYDIEGAYLNFYTQKSLEKLESKGLKVDEEYINDVRYLDYFIGDRLYVPYSYRLFYLEGVDTIAKIVNPKKRELLYTPKKYTINDTVLLQKTLDYLDLSECFLFNTPSDCDFDNRYNQCYALYGDLSNKWLFVDDVSNGKLFEFDNIRIRLKEYERMYLGYYTEKRLSAEQVAEFYDKHVNSDKIIYFYNGGRYASIMNDMTLFMLDENKAYDMDYKEGKWVLGAEKRFY